MNSPTLSTLALEIQNRDAALVVLRREIERLQQVREGKPTAPPAISEDEVWSDERLREDLRRRVAERNERMAARVED